jgi:hypothetical protein
MPYDELLAWIYYFDKRPVGWREDERTFKLLQAQGVKGKIVDIFPTLRNVYNQERSEELAEGMIAVSNLKGSFLFHQMAGALGGDELPL